MKTKNVPKITLILKKDGKKTFLHPSIKKTQFFLRSKANQLLKNAYLITIRVQYGYGINAFGKRVMFQNSGTYDKIEDLKWVFQAFVMEYLTD